MSRFAPASIEAARREFVKLCGERQQGDKARAVHERGGIEAQGLSVKPD